jgi:hypothetical protein
MLDDDLLDPIRDVAHPFFSSVVCWNVVYTERQGAGRQVLSSGTASNA